MKWIKQYALYRVQKLQDEINDMIERMMSTPNDSYQYAFLNLRISLNEWKFEFWLSILSDEN